MKKKNLKSHSQAWLLGLGLDNRDGHLRITTGENFKLFGGSKETHGSMQEKAIKMNEHLKKRGKNLNEISREEFREITDKLGISLLDTPPSRQKN